MTELNKSISGSKNNTCCSVYKCRSVAKRNSDLRFHKFPKPAASYVKIVNEFGVTEKVDRLKAWEMAVKIGKKISPYMKVCSLHFQKKDYILPDYQPKKMYLKKTAVPSCNLPASGAPITKKRAAVKDSHLPRILNRNTKKGENRAKGVNERSEREVEVRQVLKEQITDVEIKTEVVEYSEGVETHQDVGARVKSGDFALRFVHFIKSDGQLSNMTGVRSFEILKSIVTVVTLVGPSDGNAEISIEDKVVMTYIKLKENVSYAFLSVMFNLCTDHRCRQIFDEIVGILSQALRVAVSWPSREEISRNLPSCFEDFKDLVVVLNRTELFIQRSKNSCCQQLTFSHCKGSNTCSIVTGVTPAGHISFISKAYGGGASDEAIFEQSDLMNLLQPGDAVMVGRGCPIDDVCRMNRWKCIRPPILGSREQFSEAEADLDSKIACARAYVERYNRRVKSFKILRDRIPIELIPLIEEIFLVVCATVNLSLPVVKDEPF